MLPAGSAVGLPWGPCTAAQGAPLTAGAGLGLGSVLLGDSAVCPLWLLSPLSRDQSRQGLPPWAPAMGSQGESPSFPCRLGCEQSSSTRVKGGAGRAPSGPSFAWPPLLWQSLGRKGDLGQHSPLWGPGFCEHHGLDSSPTGVPLSLHR